MSKDTSVIPKGSYCYVTDVEKNKNKDKDDPVFYTKTCPYFKDKEDEGVDIVHCEFLDKGGLINGTKTEDYAKLRKKYGGNKELWAHFSLDLLWDQVKECGENNDW